MTGRQRCMHRLPQEEELTVGDAKLDDVPPGIIPLHQLVSKPVIQDQVFQVWVALVCIFDVIKEASTNDAASLQHSS